MNYPPAYDQAVSSQGGIPPSGYGSTAGGIPPSGYPGIQNHGDYPPGVHQKVPPHGPMGFPPAGNLQTITHSENSEARPLLTVLGRQPMQITCPYCQSLITTRIKKETKDTAWLWCIVLCLLGCWPCACLPFCM